MNAIDVVREMRLLAARQAGVVTAVQLLAIGLSRRQVHWRVRTGELSRRAPGLYIIGGVPPSWRQDVWLAYLAAGPGAVVCRRTAARLHGMRGRWGDAVEILVARGGHHGALLGRLCETRSLPASHFSEVDGLRVTTVARTIFDLAGEPHHPWTFRSEVLLEAHKRHTARIFNEGLRINGTTMPEMMRVLAGHGRRGLAGTRIMRQLVAEFGRDYVPTESDKEDLFLEVVRSAGLPDPEQQVDMSDREGWIGRVDFLYRHHRLVIEIDGPDHDTPLQRRADRARDARLVGAGWTVLRIRWSDLYADPEGVISRVRKHLEASA